MSGLTEAIILAGGMGTRLQSVVSDVPKPMAPVAGRPFMEYLFPMLEAAGVQHVVISIGYKGDVIQSYFGNSFRGMAIDYALEEVPLGTGGGIKLAFGHTTAQHVLVLNGDTMFRIDPLSQLHAQVESGAMISLALKEMQNFDRYGTVEIDAQGRIQRFAEKQQMTHGLINAGVYIIDRRLWVAADVPEKFSFEKDILERYVAEMNFIGVPQEGYFIDIGIPEDYARAQVDFASA